MDTITRLNLIMPQSLLDEVNEWRYAERIPSQPEAVRRLIREALAEHRKPHKVKEKGK